jgi:hypothetical protein
MDFHYSLLENGLDFVLSSLESLTLASAVGPSIAGAAPNVVSDQKRHLKYALLHLCSGVELIFKERIRQEDWQLLFADPEKADEGAYQSGDFWSIDFKQAQERLEEDCAVELTQDEKAQLKSFRKRRNQLEHFGVEDTLPAVQSSITKMVNLLVDFVGRAFDEGGLEEEESLLAEIRTKLGNCRAVVDDRMALIKAELDKQYSLVQCPSCHQLAMSADGGTVKCLFCHLSADSDTAAEEYVVNILGYPSQFEVEKDGGEWPVRACPECGSETFVTELRGVNDIRSCYCFDCGISYSGDEVELCHDCNEYYVHGGEAGCHICPDCFHAKVSRDD